MSVKTYLGIKLYSRGFSDVQIGHAFGYEPFKTPLTFIRRHMFSRIRHMG